MKHFRTLLGLAIGLLAAGTSNAAVVTVGDPTPGVQAGDLISVSTTWTANNTYDLLDQVYVVNGATLTIEAGVVVASDTTASGKAGLCITRGAKINAVGTRQDPIIFTSKADVATWQNMPAHPTGKNPKTGVWRASCNEWGNVTLEGRAYMSNGPTQPHCDPASGCTNTSIPNANNFSVMEGLVAEDANDQRVRYGGGDDDDNSGRMSYVSQRYGGRVVGLAVELNGLSLGAIGRATQLDHLDIMNNVDDGIEIWGGTVNLKYVNIWNIGDDSFDLDQGWRGKAQFGLIVQGYSVDAVVGSGVNDSAFETDGAEDSDAQPVTTSTIYNFTVVGQPVQPTSGRGTAWRDGARVQYRNCIFMDLGRELISNQNSADGAHGYGFNGTLTFAQIWTTNWNNYSGVNPFPGGSNATQYPVQTSGKLAEITDSVFFRNLNAAAYTESDLRGVTSGGGSTGTNIVAAYNAGNPNQNMPIKTLNRGGPVMLQGGTLTQLPVIGIDPRAANAATSSAAAAPADGFFTPASYRGAFSSTKNWICGWTAADAFGFVIKPAGACVANCPADITGNDIVDIDDLVQVITHWGTSGTPGTVVGDVNGNGVVNIDDLVAVIVGWGEC